MGTKVALIRNYQQNHPFCIPYLIVFLQQFLGHKRVVTHGALERGRRVLAHQVALQLRLPTKYGSSHVNVFFLTVLIILFFIF